VASGHSIHRAGDEGLLIRFDDSNPGALPGLRDRLLEERGVRACVVAHSSLLVLCDRAWFLRGAAQDAIAEILREFEADARTRPHARHDIPVDFSSRWSPDLALLARRVGSSSEAVVERIASLRLTARYLGFLAGFAYLDGWPEEWSLPRRSEARVRVPRGTFAVAGSMAGLYPAETPGGWNLLGRTDVELWNADRDPPNLIAPGDEIRIVPATLRFDAGPAPVTRVSREPIVADVVSGGQRTFIVGLPRDRRYGHGIAAGGAFDREALDAANRAVGNPGGSSGLEAVLVGPSLRFRRSAVLAWFGAEVSPAVNGRAVGDPRQFAAGSGDLVEIGPIRQGARGVLAIQGGLVDPGAPFETTPTVIATGDSLRGYPPSSATARIRALVRTDPGVIRVRPGPDPTSLEIRRTIERREWSVTNSFDRVGVRLTSEGKVPDLPGDLVSSGMQFGTVQWHPGGELVVMGPDHPVTGGYLQPMTVASSDLWKIARLAPGDRVRFLFEPWPRSARAQ